METEDRLTALELRTNGLNTRMNKVCDWLTTHDERMAEARNTLTAINELESGGGKTFDTAEELIANLDPPSIVSELEAGLVEANGKWWHDTDKPCTYILLPTAQWEEYCEPDSPMGANPAPTFHDIPVYGLPIDSVVYGTEAI